MLKASSPRRTPVGTLMMTEITSGLNNTRRHEGMRIKVMDTSKRIKVLQGPDESPRQFYKQLCEAFYLCTPFDPEVAKNQRIINAEFFSQHSRR
jgi:hypothetical protein